MGLKLLILSWWTPKFVVSKELSNVANQTTSALALVVTAHAPQEIDNMALEKSAPQTSVEGQRATMAKIHAQLVDALEAAVGHEQAVKLCREALFTVGQNLGRKTRSKLGVGNSQKDLIRAAKILYRILGIGFELEWIDNTNVKLTIDRCALVEQYSKLTCEVLSATDEGAITGLQPNASMRFTQYMTDGCGKCTADIQFKERKVAK
ncbi:MAG: L-2-amino-thiazoline-4-carboxylic acid hydrolase [Halobacteriota archaeon]